MKKICQNEMIKVEIKTWENEIRKSIFDWEELLKSFVCDTEDRKQAARKIVMKLHEMLETLLCENGITDEQFKWFNANIKSME